MTAYISRPYTPRTYMCPVTMEQHGPTAYRIVSQPPIHYGTLIQQGREGLWKVTVTSLVIQRRYVYAEYESGRRALADMVARLAGREFMTYTGAQRLALGQQHCPRKLAKGVCSQPASVGTVWCEWHPKGEDRQIT